MHHQHNDDVVQQDSPHHDDTLGGLDGSPHVGSGGAGAGGYARRSHHMQSQSLDEGLAGSGSPVRGHRHGGGGYDEAMTGPETRYSTPPLSAGLGPGAGSQHQQLAYEQQQVHSQHQQGQQIAGPASGLSNGGDRHMQGSGYGQSAVEHGSRSSDAGASSKERAHVVIKVGMVGDAQIGKTSLMVKYVEGSWDEDYIQTLGVNFMEKTISIRNTEITFSIWDLGGQREFVNMLPLVCNDAVAILFMFDLTRKSTLNSIKEWYRQGRGFNKTAIPILVGTKYDHFVNFPREDQEEISNQVCKPIHVDMGKTLFLGMGSLANSKTGKTVRQGDAGGPHLQQYEPQHQRPKGRPLVTRATVANISPLTSQ